MAVHSINYHESLILTGGKTPKAETPSPFDSLKELKNDAQRIIALPSRKGRSIYIADTATQLNIETKDKKRVLEVVQEDVSRGKKTIITYQIPDGFALGAAFYADVAENGKKDGVQDLVIAFVKEGKALSPQDNTYIGFQVFFAGKVEQAQNKDWSLDPSCLHPNVNITFDGAFRGRTIKRPPGSTFNNPLDNKDPNLSFGVQAGIQPLHMGSVQLGVFAAWNHNDRNGTQVGGGVQAQIPIANTKIGTVQIHPQIAVIGNKDNQTLSMGAAITLTPHAVHFLSVGAETTAGIARTDTTVTTQINSGVTVRFQVPEQKNEPPAPAADAPKKNK